MAKAKSGTGAYWLSGEEHCPHCLFRYAFVVERRCAVCDGPACPHCVTVTRTSGDVTCRECELARDDDDDVGGR